MTSTHDGDGKFSTEQYTDCLTTTFDYYGQKTGKTLKDFAACVYIFHSPSKALKDCKLLLRMKKLLVAWPNVSRKLSSIIRSSAANTHWLYFLSLLSLLENSRALEAGDQMLFIVMVAVLYVRFLADPLLRVIRTT